MEIKSWNAICFGVVFSWGAAHSRLLNKRDINQLILVFVFNCFISTVCKTVYEAVKTKYQNGLVDNISYLEGSWICKTNCIDLKTLEFRWICD